MDELFAYARDQCQEHHQDVGHLFGTFDAAVCLTELIYDRLRTKDFPTSISTSALLSSSSGENGFPRNYDVLASPANSQLERKGY